MEKTNYVVTLRGSIGAPLLARLAKSPFFDATTQENIVQVNFKTFFSEPHAMKQLIDLLSEFRVQVLIAAKCVSPERLRQINRALSR